MENVRIEGMRLGRTPKREDPRSLKLESLLPKVIPQPPASVDVTTGVTQWPVYANDRLGDCTCAAVGHMLEIWTEQAHNTPRILSDAQVIALYNLVNNGQDQGANMLDVLHQMRVGAGLAGDKVFAYAAVDSKQTDLVKAALWLFTGLYIGIQMPLSAKSQTGPGTVWDVATGTDGQVGSWGGHAVNVVAFDSSGVTVVTWGALQKMTWGFWSAYVDECWALIPDDYEHLKGTLQANGFNFAELQQYLQSVGPVDQVAGAPQ
jgi:hypothetical protein